MGKLQFWECIVYQELLLPDMCEIHCTAKACECPSVPLHHCVELPVKGQSEPSYSS